MGIYDKRGPGRRWENRKISSAFYNFHPSVLLLYYVGAVFFSLAFPNPVFVITVFILALAVSFYYCGKKAAIKALFASLVFGALVFIINPILNHRGSVVLFYAFDNPITLEATLFGLFNMIMVMSMLMIFSSFNAVIDTERFLYLFSGLVPKISFIISMAIRYVSLFSKRAKELAGVLKTRGIDVKSGARNDKIRGASVFFSALTEWSLEDSMCVAQSLKAKGYSSGRRKVYSSFTFTLKDRVWIFVLCVMLGGSICLCFLGAGGFSFYPRLKAIDFSLYDATEYAVMVFMMLMPFIAEFLRMAVFKLRQKRKVVKLVTKRPY